MKHLKFSFIIFFFFLPALAFSQTYSGYLGNASKSVFSDARELRSKFFGDLALNPEARKLIMEKLTLMYSSEGNPKDSLEIIDIIRKSNLPIAGILLSNDEYNIALSRISSSDLSSRGSIVSTFVDILSGVIISKSSIAAKSALFNTFLSQIFKNRESRILFPNTKEYFDSFEKSKLTAAPRLFAESFKADLKTIPFNVSKIFTSIKQYRDTLESNPHLKIYTEAYRYYKDIRSLKSIFKINHQSLTNLKVNNGVQSELYNSLKLLQYIYFQMNTDEQITGTSKGVMFNNAKMINDDHILQDLFLGLLCAQNPNIQFSDTSLNAKNESGGLKGSNRTLFQITPLINLSKKKENDNITKYIYNYSEKYYQSECILDSISNLYEYTESDKEELKNEYFNKSVEFLEYALNPSNLYPDGSFDKSEIDLFINIIKKYKQLEDNINNGQNFAALMNTFYIYGDICKTHKAFGDLFNVFSGDFLKTISIVADILSAKNDQEIANIANEYFFSGTDAEAKKEFSFSILVNSYAGYYYGKENDFVTNNWTRNRGLTAPIGFEFSKGFGNYGNLSLFIPVLDLGAIVDYKLSNDSTETVTNLDINNVFSPGVYLVYGLPKIPVSLGGGFQFSPQLGKINLNGSVIEPRKLRWNVFLALDLPLLRIFNN